MRRAASLLLALAALHAAACRKITGLDQYTVEPCTDDDPSCQLPPEDCVSRADTNADGVSPSACTGAVAWLRATAGTSQETCTDTTNTSYMVSPSRHLAALASFGAWGATAGSFRGSLAGCYVSGCSYEVVASDGKGEGISFAPPLPCEDSADLEALARGDDHAYAATASQATVAVSAHRLKDGSFGASWQWKVPSNVTSLGLAAGPTAVLALGQGNTGTLLAVPDPAVAKATFHLLASAHLTSIAVTRGDGARPLLLGGVTTDPKNDPGPCGLAATTPTAFIARATLTAGSSDATMPTPLGCDGFALQFDVGADTGNPSFQIAAGPTGQVCWAYAGNDSTKNARNLHVGCAGIAGDAPSWQKGVNLGKPINEAVSVAVDPFGHVVVAASLQDTADLTWGGQPIPLAAPSTPNILVVKLRGDSGALVWGHMFAAPGGNARNPHVAADDDGLVRVGIVTDGPALIGDGIAGLASASGYALYTLGLAP